VINAPTNGNKSSAKENGPKYLSAAKKGAMLLRP
jgi:hypothetical protein